MLRVNFFFFFLLPLLFTSCKQTDFPKIWSSYMKTSSYEVDFANMQDNGIQIVEFGVGQFLDTNMLVPAMLEAARKHNIKFIINMPDVTEEAFLMNKDSVERAIFIGGSYNGKAIDRNVFSFSKGKHQIKILRPTYDSIRCYKKYGRYFENIHAPLRSEVIIKQKDFDGSQHLKIIEAKLASYDSIYTTMEFELADTDGDLNQVILAVYWISEGARDHWILGDAASPASNYTRRFLYKRVNDFIKKWSDANGGSFPSDLISAFRYGDECFVLTGHANERDASYPLYDYSESGIAAFKKCMPNCEYPRAKAFFEFFGRDAYAAWLFTWHSSCASLANIVKLCLKDNGISPIPVFRNFTRMNIFDPINDHDGTGLDLLCQYFDIVQIDPYPLLKTGYDNSLIPHEMHYISGFSRRYAKPLIPWLQAHTYGASIDHPKPADLDRMINQHTTFAPDAIMWLGYGPANEMTFPDANPKSWQRAKEINAEFCRSNYTKTDARIAVIRPYTVRALRDLENRAPLDAFFTDSVLNMLADKNIFYDAFEPFNCSKIIPSQLKNYDVILATLGSLKMSELSPFINSKKTCILFIYGADIFDEIPSEIGVKGLLRRKVSSSQLTGVMSELTILGDIYDLGKAQAISTTSDGVCVWKMNNLVFISCVGFSMKQNMIEQLLSINLN